MPNQANHSTVAEQANQTTVVFPAEARPLDFIRLSADNTVTVLSKHMEMGQGIYTLMATLVAEELDAAPEQMRVEQAPINPAIYGNPLLGGAQGTGGQTSTQASYLTMRMAGAAMRQMILGAAAAHWQTDQASLRIVQGVVSDASGRRLTFGELAQSAMAMPVPNQVTVKKPVDFTYIGKHFDRIDAPDKARGKTIFTQDLSLPGMLTAVIARPPRYGAKAASFDAAAPLQFPGVRHVVAVPNGVAVVADNFWAAYEGRERLKIDWDNSQAQNFSTDTIYSHLRSLLDQPGTTAVSTGDVDAALASAACRLSADYEIPYQAHASFETLNIIMQMGGAGIEIWGAVQIPVIDLYALSQATGLPPEKIKFNTLMAGGSFGRRSSATATPSLEVLSIIQALQTDRPVKLIYSREDDMGSTATRYRPGYVHRIEAGIDTTGALVAWKHRIVGQSVLIGTAFEEALVVNGIDEMVVESASDQPYAIPNVYLDIHMPELPIQTSWQRSTGSFHNIFANESMVDEVAVAVDLDPLELRRRLIPATLRERKCLELVVEKATWTQPLAAAVPDHRRGRGLAVGPGHRSYGAVVVEVTVAPDNNYTVDRIVCALDCGIAINPDNIRSQIEGSAGFGLSMTRYSKMTFKAGAAEQRFYSDHHIVRMHTMPKIEAYIVPSDEGPSGSSETITGLIAPALANALFDATGIRVRTVPLRLPDEPPEEHWDVPATLNTFRGAIALLR